MASVVAGLLCLAPVAAQADSGLEAECVKAATARPQPLEYLRTSRVPAGDDGKYFLKVQVLVGLPAMPETCTGSFRRSGVVRFQFRDAKHAHWWLDGSSSFDNEELGPYPQEPWSFIVERRKLGCLKQVKLKLSVEVTNLRSGGTVAHRVFRRAPQAVSCRGRLIRHGKHRRSRALVARTRPPRVAWTLPQSVSEGQPIAFSWSARGSLGRKHRLVVQRQVGTAHSWKSVLRLQGRSGSAELPGLALGHYRLRIADLVGRGRVLAKQVSGIGVFGQVPFTTLVGTPEQVYSTSSFTFPYVFSHQIIGSEITALTVEHNHCNFVYVAFVPGKGYRMAPGTVSVIQETRDPVSATTDKNTIGSLDAELVPGQSWSITETSTDVEPVFFFNGYAICSSAEGFS